MHRILMAADPAAARLVEIARSPTTEPKDAIIAIRELLDRAGIGHKPMNGAGQSDSTVLWEEFLAIHRRRVLGAHGDAETETDAG
jgi:hypothetical protein